MSMTAQNTGEDDLTSLKQEVLASVASAKDAAALDEVRIAALGKKGRVTECHRGAP
jgi:hypothetical protein